MAEPRGVQFTSDSADRIARVVRIVEAGSRQAEGLDYAPRLQPPPLRLRVGTFTGSWDVGELKLVTLVDSTQTINVHNWTTPVFSQGDQCDHKVVFSRVHGTASLLEVEFHPPCLDCLKSFGGADLSRLPGYEQTETQMLGHNENGCLAWYSITTCSTATSG